MANHFNLINAGVPKILNTVNFFHSVLGPKPLQFISSWLNKVRVVSLCWSMQWDWCFSCNTLHRHCTLTATCNCLAHMHLPSGLL